jgi:hypothetical protein
MGSRSTVTRVTKSVAWKYLEDPYRAWHVTYERNKQPGHMTVAAEDELDAFKEAQKRLEVMDKREDEACRVREEYRKHKK